MKRNRLIAGVAGIGLLAMGLYPAITANAAQVRAAGVGAVAPLAGLPASPTDSTKVPHYFGPWPNWANSPQVTQNAVVTFSAPQDPNGVRAEGSATVDPKTGGITGVTITNPGSGYTTATVSFDAPGQTITNPASGTVTVTTGAVQSVTVDDRGFDYVEPVVSFTGQVPLSGASATAFGSLDSLTIVNPGEGYQLEPLVTITDPEAPDGRTAKANATMDENGVLTGIEITDAGAGYSHAPTVTIASANTAAPTIPAQVSATLGIDEIRVVDGGSGYAGAPTVEIADASGAGQGASATAVMAAGGSVDKVTILAANRGAGYLTPGIRKFVDTLSGLGPTAKNNLNNYIPVAVADKTTYPGTDYYEIGLVQYRHKFSSDLSPTLMRGYVQLSTSVVPGKQAALVNAPVDPNGTATPVAGGYKGVDDPHYLGPTIVATKDRPVRILFRNLLPTGAGGDLFLPVDTTLMGAGVGPNAMTLDPNGVPVDMAEDQRSVTDEVRNPYCTLTTPKPQDCYTDNRATIHLHGGITPWISDGTPHQWITPAGEQTDYPKGVSVSNVPDMPDPGPGAQTFFYTNQQSARLLFYHDHAWGITRLNVYAGEAAGYLITDETEQSLFGAGKPFADLGTGIPLIIQEKTFVPSDKVMYDQTDGDGNITSYGADPTWDKAKWGGEGSLWAPHVYMPAQNPSDPSGMSGYGRWMYGPWFWPPATNTKYGPIPNPYYDPNCSLDDPNTWQYQTDPFCEPQQIPGTANLSVGMEAFHDTPMVNGTAYPKTTVAPKSYRFRILNASNDRFWNLSWYVADPTTGTLSEVALKANEVEAAQTDPVVFPTPDTTKSPKGPNWIQIGTEGGFLPKPVVIPASETVWVTDPTRFDVGNVDHGSLIMAPAERADVIVDFSQFRGKTLILYNDAPAAFPARVPSYDYYTGAPDLSPVGAKKVLPGYGPNTRTIMKVTVSSSTPGVQFDKPGTTNDRLGQLMGLFGHQPDNSGVFESGQNPIVVGQAAYNDAYGTNFVSAGYCSDPDNPTPKCDGYARIQQQGGMQFKFDTLAGPQLSIPIQPKGIHDEMNSANFDEFGRMSANMGLEAPGATPLTQNIILYPYNNPSTENLNVTNASAPNSLNVTPITVNTDGTQIWKITHNGVDTHPIHFHLYDIQILNRVAWDNNLRPPADNELGWKDTIRVSPLEDTIVAVRPIKPTLPFAVPDSKRPLNPMMPLGARGNQNGPNGNQAGFNNTDALGNPITPIVNEVVNFYWEYVWHCHILSHEEMDMMRPQTLQVRRALADAPVLTWTRSGGNKLTWTDGTPVDYTVPTSWLVNEDKAEVGYRIERATVKADGSADVWSPLATAIANQTTFTDAGADPAIPYRYRVTVWNAAGDTVSNEALVADLPGAPTDVTAIPGDARATVSWTAPVATGGLNITGYWVEWSNDAGGTWTRVTSNTGSTATSLLVNGLTPGSTYSFRVRAITAAGVGPYSVPSAGATVLTVPGAPTGLTAVAGLTSAALTWVAPVSNGGSAITGYGIEWSSNNGSTWTRVTSNTGSTSTTFTVNSLTAGTSYIFRVRANNAVGSGAWSTNSTPVTPYNVPNAPAAPVATAGSSQASLTWVAPAANGLPVTGYAVEWSSDGGTNWTRVTSNTGTTATSMTVPNLTPGTSYRFRVRAINGAGAGAWSANSNAVTPFTVPGTPGTPTATAGSSSAALTWTAPLSNGGSAITGYAVEWSSNGGATWTRFTSNTGSTATSINVTGLTAGTSYVFHVRAINAAGTSAWTANSNAVTPYTVPGAPTNVAGVAGPSRVSLTWTAPANGGQPITGYAVERQVVGTGTWVRVTSNTGNATTAYTVINLTPGTAYIFRVRAINLAGNGNWSTPSASVTPTA